MERKEQDSLESLLTLFSVNNGSGEEAIKEWIINLAINEYHAPYLVHRLNVNDSLLPMVSLKHLRVNGTVRIGLQKH